MSKSDVSVCTAAWIPSPCELTRRGSGVPAGGEGNAEGWGGRPQCKRKTRVSKRRRAPATTHLFAAATKSHSKVCEAVSQAREWSYNAVMAMQRPHGRTDRENHELFAAAASPSAAEAILLQVQVPATARAFVPPADLWYGPQQWRARWQASRLFGCRKDVGAVSSTSPVLAEAASVFEQRSRGMVFAWAGECARKGVRAGRA